MLALTIRQGCKQANSLSRWLKPPYSCLIHYHIPIISGSIVLLCSHCVSFNSCVSYFASWLISEKACFCFKLLFIFQFVCNFLSVGATVSPSAPLRLILFLYFPKQLCAKVQLPCFLLLFNSVDVCVYSYVAFCLHCYNPLASSSQGKNHLNYFIWRLRECHQ